MKNTLIVLLSLMAAIAHGQSGQMASYKTLLDTTIQSEFLGFEKQITVTVPFNWQQDLEAEFPLIVVFDSQNERSHGYILNTMEYLTSNQQMPASVVISVKSEEKHRFYETQHQVSDEKGKMHLNEQFLFEELIPLAEEKWKASDFRVFIGHSRYGYFTTNLFHSRTDDLNAVISLSPFFYQKNVNLVDSLVRLKERELNSSKYYRFGIGNDYPDQFLAMDSALKTMDHPMINTSGKLFKEADHNATPGLTIAPALYDIFEYWSEAQAVYFDNDNSDFGQLTIQSKKISEHYGNDLNFALGILNGKGWYFYNEGEFELAISAWQEMLRCYPNFSVGYLFISYAEQELGRNSEATIKSLRASLKTSEIYSDEEKAELMNELENLKP